MEKELIMIEKQKIILIKILILQEHIWIITLRKNELTYTKEFDKYLKENNLQCHLRSNSIIMCQMVFTSDQAFFDKIGEKETK